MVGCDVWFIKALLYLKVHFCIEYIKVRYGMANNNSRSNGRNSINRKKKNSGRLAVIVLLLLLSAVGVFVIIFLSKDLMSGNGVNKETTVPFTANIETVDVKSPKGVEVTAAQFINNVDGAEGVVCEFKENPDVNKEGKSQVEILVKAADKSSKEFTASLEIYTDTQAPDIEGVVDRHFNVGDNITYLKGVKAVDDMEGDVSVEVDKSGIEFDENGNAKEGVYQVVYSATDKAGNKAEKAAAFYFEINGVNDEMIDEAIDKALSLIIKEDMTIEQKAYAIYNYTYDNIAYTGTSTKGDYRVEAYNGLTTFQGDCYTYFSVAKALLNKIGAATIDVERAPGVRNDHHYWLLVDLGSGYYHFDATRRVHYFNGFMATDAQVKAYSTNVVNGFYYFDETLYPATPATEFTFTQYAGN